MILIEELVIILDRARKLIQTQNSHEECSFCKMETYHYHDDGCPMLELIQAVTGYMDEKNELKYSDVMEY